jgi:hypothetical protein
MPKQRRYAEHRLVLHLGEDDKAPSSGGLDKPRFSQFQHAQIADQQLAATAAAGEAPDSSMIYLNGSYCLATT